jgi:hypothetical protein
MKVKLDRMMRVSSAIVAIASSSLLVSPAVAQPENPYGGGTRLERPREPAQWPIDQSRPILADFGACAVKRAPDLARTFILRSETVSFDSRYLSLFNPSCFTNALIHNSVLSTTKLEMSKWRGRTMIAAALVNQDLANFDASQIRFAGPISRLTIPAKMLAASTPKEKEQLLQERQAVALEALAECVVRANPTGAQVLLRSKLNSDEEMRAIQGLMPDLDSCLNKGSQFKLDRGSLRGAVAFDFYRLAYAPRTGAAQ